MIGFFIFGICSFFFSIISSITKRKDFFFFSFFLIFLFQAIRYNYGNDYISYKEIFVEINESNLFETRYEIGWIVLNKLFYYLGFQSLIAFISLFISYVYYKFIIHFLKPNYYWLGFFIFIFDPNNLLINITAIRQSIAIAFFLLSIINLVNKKLLPSFILLVTATFFHTSSLIIFPILLIVFFLNRFLKNKKIYKFILLPLYISVFYITENLKDYIFLLNTVFADGKYYSYTTTDVVNVANLFNVLFYSYLFYIILHYSSFKIRQNSYLFSLSIVGLVFIPLALLVPLIARFSYYFLPILIVLIPIIYDQMKNVLYKNIFFLIIISVTLLRLFRFFYSETYYSGFFEYQTIFKI
jgi:hypothetical protein